MESTSSSRQLIHSFPSSSLSLQDDSRQREWTRQVLREYLGKYVRDFLGNRRDTVPSPVSSSLDIDDTNGNSKSSNVTHGDGLHNMKTLSISNGDGDLGIDKDNEEEGEHSTENELMSLQVTDLEIVDETAVGDDRITYLSRILSVGVSYAVADHPEHFVQWIVKVPSRSFDERNLARVTNVYRREVSFYVDILQDIKLWLEHNYKSADIGKHFALNVPTCFYATSSSVADIDIDPNNYEFPNPEFTLVLEDLRAQGFGKRHYSTTLSLQEVTEATREICKFHVVAWAMAQHSPPEQESAGLHWEELLKWEPLHSLFLDMIQQGFRNLRIFRQPHMQPSHQGKVDKTREKLIDRLLELETKLPALLEKLLQPLPPPWVTTLVHMDLWTDNLLFRKRDSDSDPGQDEEEGEDEQRSTGDSSPSRSQDGELDCMILDWQMISLGRVTHDLAILLMTSLDSEIRRSEGMFLLKFYYDLFERYSSAFKLEVPFQFSELVDQYKESCLLAILLAVGRLDLVVSEQSTLDRFFEGLKDLKDEQLI